MTSLGLFLIVAGVIAFLVGLVLVCIESLRKAGLIVLLTGIAMFIIGFSVCSSFPFRIH